MKKIVLLRHGESVWNRENRFTGWTDVDLSEKGVAEAVKAGVRSAGGTPFEFPAIAVCDGLAMNHEGMRFSLPSREIIADSIEIMAMAHPFDGLVLIPNCDKCVPGMLMAALRLDPLSLKALDDLRGQVLNDMKGEELSEALTAYGASLEHNLSSSAMNRMPASKIVNSSTN